MLKIQTCPCSEIYVNAGIVMVSVSKYINFLNNLRDSIWFDICSVRDTSERQFLDFFFLIFLILRLFQRSSWDRGLHYLLLKGFPFGMPELFAKILMTP